MATTMLKNLVNPEVMTQMISAALPKKIKFSTIAKIDTTLEGRPGNTITVPKWGYIGDAAEVAENEAMDTAQLTTTTTEAVIKKVGKAVDITDEAKLSAYGDPMGETVAQLGKAIASKIDNDCYDALLGAVAKYDGTAAKIGYEPIVNANALIADESDTVLNKIIFIHPDQEATLRKDSDFIDRAKSGMDVIMTGTIGMICGCQVVKSKRVRKVEFDIKAATASGYTEVTAENLATYADKSGESESGIRTVAVGDFVKALTKAYYACPIVVVDEKDPNEDPAADKTGNDAPAITIYLKRNVMVENDRDVKRAVDTIAANEHYTTVLSNDSKVCLAKFGA